MISNILMTILAPPNPNKPEQLFLLLIVSIFVLPVAYCVAVTVDWIIKTISSNIIIFEPSKRLKLTLLIRNYVLVVAKVIFGFHILPICSLKMQRLLQR